MDDHEILFLPGPTEVDSELRQVMSMPLVGHRSKGFIEEVKAVCSKLKPLFKTDAYALFENCSATMMMEVATRNLVNERSLHLVLGAFSDRWYKVAVGVGRKPDKIEVPFGDVITTDMLREKLVTDGPYEAVMITHSETSTGELAPLREMAAAIRESSPDTLVLVDAVSALAGAEMHFDEWGIDMVFAGTQKCLALPPGLCVYALSERAMQKAATVPARGWLTDFVRAADQLGKGKTPATPCVPLVYALSKQLDRIAAETMEGRWERHRLMHGMVHEWADAKGYEFLVQDGYRSPTVSAMKNSGRVVTDLIAKAKEIGFTLGNGYGKLKGETFRIGHMGDHPPARLSKLLSVLD